MADRDPAGRRQPRAIVSINYGARLGVYALAFALVLVAGGSHPLGLSFWIPLTAFAAAWPHAAFVLARRSPDPRRAERRSVLVDAAAAGAISALLAFRVWPTVVLWLPPIMSNMRAGGLPRAGLAFAVSATAALGVAAVLGVPPHPDANPATVAISILFLVAYISYFALVTRSQGEALRRRGAALAGALERQTATSEILRTISATRTDVTEVFEAIIRSSLQLCGATMGGVFRFDGELIHLVAEQNGPAAGRAATRAAFPRRPGRDSMVARVIMERDVVHVPDVEADPDYRMHAVSRAIRMRGFLGVPLVRDGQPIGVIGVGREHPGPFTEAQIESLKSFADQAVIAVDNARLFTDLQARTEELAGALDETRALGEIMQAAGSSLDLQEVLDAVVRHAVEHLGADGGAIVEHSPRTRSFVAVSIYRMDQNFLDRIAATPVDPTEGRVAESIKLVKPWQIPDVDKAHRYIFREEMLAAGYRALMAVPIPSPEIIRGLVVYRRTPGRFDERKAQFLLAVAIQSKMAIDNATLFSTTQNQGAELERLSSSLRQLYRLSTAMQEPLTLREQLQRVFETASRIGIIDRMYVWRRDGDRLVNLAGAGFSDEEWRALDGTSIPLAQAGAMARALRDGTPLLFTREAPLPPELRLPSPWGDQHAFRTREFLVIPMIARGETVGIFAGDNKPSGRPLSAATLDLLQTFASHAAVAIVNARLFGELADKSRQLEIASQHKSEFLSNMSHELRTPLNAIIGFAEVLGERMFGDLNDKQEEYVRDITESGRHLLSLINDILDLSKVEAGRMELDLSSVDLPGLIENALVLVRERAARRGVAVHRALDERVTTVTGDERKLKQVLLNLLSNAVKFTPEGGRIDVTATLVEDAVAVAVRDTGVGIAPDDLDAVFEEFRQVGSSAARQEGTGLGLALSRRFIELHGGTIRAESAPGLGSTFTFTLPLTAHSVTG